MTHDIPSHPANLVMKYMLKHDLYTYTTCPSVTGCRSQSLMERSGSNGWLLDNLIVESTA
jgi:hypothetical protein